MKTKDGTRLKDDLALQVEGTITDSTIEATIADSPNGTEESIVTRAYTEKSKKVLQQYLKV